MNSIFFQKLMKFVLRPLYFSLLIVCSVLFFPYTIIALDFFFEIGLFPSCWGVSANETMCQITYFYSYYFYWRMLVRIGLICIYLWCRKKGIRLPKFFDYLAKALTVFLGIYLLGLVHFIAKHGLT